MGSEDLVTRRYLVSDIARNTDPNAKIPDIISRNVAVSAHRVINELSGQGSKHKRGKAKKAKKPAR